MASGRAIELTNPIQSDSPLVEKRGPFTITPNGLRVDEEPSFEQWGEQGPHFATYDRGMAFIVGDWINFGEGKFGEQAAQVIDVSLGWSTSTMNVYRNLANNIAPADRRMDRLGVRHHLLVQTFAPKTQRKWLAKAAADDEEKPWSVSRLAKAIKEGHDQQVTSWFVLVTCNNAAHQAELLSRFESEGLAVKKIERRTSAP